MYLNGFSCACQSSSCPPQKIGVQLSLAVRLAGSSTTDSLKCEHHHSAVGRLWGHLAQDPPHHVVVAEKRSGTPGGGLSAVAVRGEAALGPRAHLTAPYWPCYSLDQQTAGQYLGRLGTPGDGHVPTRPQSPLDSADSAAEHPEGTKRDPARGTCPGPTASRRQEGPADPGVHSTRMQIFCFVGLFFVLLEVLQKLSGTYLHAAYICGVGYLTPTPAGVVQRYLLFVVVVQAGCAGVLLFLLEHFGTVQCPMLSCSAFWYSSWWCV